MLRPTHAAALTEAVYYILLSLQVPRHGYGIMQFVQTLSGHRVQLAAGTLYGALNSLVEKGWIEAVESGSGRKKEYVLTSEGRRVLMNELRRLEELVRHGQAELGGIES